MPEVLMIAGGALVVLWAIAILIGVWKIVAVLTCKQYPIIDMNEGGQEYRIQVIRVQGRFGASYQVKGGNSQKVDPTFFSYAEVSNFIRNSVKP